MSCDARHDGHDCTAPGACARALTAMCQRISERDRGERAPLPPNADRYVMTPDQYRTRTNQESETS